MSSTKIISKNHSEPLSDRGKTLEELHKLCAEPPGEAQWMTLDCLQLPTAEELTERFKEMMKNDNPT